MVFYPLVVLSLPTVGVIGEERYLWEDMCVGRVYVRGALYGGRDACGGADELSNFLEISSVGAIGCAKFSSWGCF